MTYICLLYLRVFFGAVVEGVIQAKDFFDGELLQFAGDSVQQVFFSCITSFSYKMLLN